MPNLPSLSSRPITVRASSVATLPDPDLVADILDTAAAAQPAKLRELLSDPDAELDVWVNESGSTVYVGDRVLHRVGPEDAS
jgi:hypothetical protein